ncbi:ankyrin repeat domain-containing protein [archaeon]|nr:MAG: ankyrin repeat domain-containing protein [archaeon]
MGTTNSACACRVTDVRDGPRPIAPFSPLVKQDSSNSNNQHDAQEDNISDVSLQLSPPSQDTMNNVSLSNLADLTTHTHTLTHTHTPTQDTKPPDYKEIIDHLFLLTDAGLLSTIKFLVAQYGGVTRAINTTKPVCLGDFSSELTLVQLAVCMGYCDILRYYLAMPEVYVHVFEPTYQMSLVHLAVYFEQTYCLYVLLKDTRLNILEQDITGKTALHRAVQQRYDIGVDSLLNLVSSGDYHRARDYDGNTVLHMAASHPDEGILTMLLHYLNTIAFASPSTGEVAVVGGGWQKKVQFFGALNSEGLTAMDMLKLKIEGLESRRRPSDASSSAQESKELEEEGKDKEQDLPNAPPTTLRRPKGGDADMGSVSSQDLVIMDELALCRGCLRIIQEASYCPAEVLDSLASILLPIELTTTESANDQSSDESACAFSWSPANELKMKTRLAAKKRMRVQESGGVGGRQDREDVFMSPLALSID